MLAAQARQPSRQKRRRRKRKKRWKWRKRLGWPVGWVARIIEEHIRGKDLGDGRLRDGLVEEMLAECPMEVGFDGVLLLLPGLWMVGEVFSRRPFAGLVAAAVVVPAASRSAASVVAGHVAAEGDHQSVLVVVAGSLFVQVLSSSRRELSRSAGLHCRNQGV